MKNMNQQSFLQISLSSIIAQKPKKKKIQTLAHWNTVRHRYKIVQNIKDS